MYDPRLAWMLIAPGLFLLIIFLVLPIAVMAVYTFFTFVTAGIAYNTKMISPEEAKEKGASLLLDKKYAGKIGGYADMDTRVWYAALATGQDAKVRETRDLAKKFWSLNRVVSSKAKLPEVC